MRKKLIFYFSLLFLALVISLPLILPYFKTGFFPTHDGEWAVVRLSDLYREVKDLQFPVRYSGYLNFQYGYPLFNFAYPLPYYLGLTFVFLKLGFVGSVKFLFAISVIGSFFSMFLLSNSLWKSKLAGLISAVLYIYAPYRIVDLFVRGSIGESLSFVLFPLIMLGIKRVYEKKDLTGILFTGTSFALLITTHNIMTVLFGIFIGIIFLIALIQKKTEFILKSLIAFMFAFALSAFFWVPAIFEKNLILLSKIPIADRSLYFVKPLELIIPKWGYGVPTDPSGFGYQIGTAQLVVFILALVLIIKSFIKHKNKENSMGLFLGISTVFISILFFSFTAFIWAHTPLLSEINYPWTLLAVVMFLISLLSGFLAKQGKIIAGLGLILLASAIIMYLPHAKPQYFVNRGEGFYTTNQATTTSSNELMPLWVKQQPLKSWDKKVEVSKDGVVENLVFNSRKIVFSVNLPQKQTIRINTIYYPGWKIFVDEKPAQINYNNPKGVVDIDISAGPHSIKGIFTETPLRAGADVLSLISFLGLVCFTILVVIKKLKKL
jgi:hypothetical protein